MLRAQNKVKQKVCDGETALGFVCRSLSPVVVELIGLSGFDFVWIDMEHTTADFALVEHLCRAADATGIEALVRVPDKHPSSVLRALEAGASIVNVPQIESRDEAEAIVRAAKYHPLGQRGFCSSSRGTGYGYGGTAKEIFATANERVLTMAQIESRRGVERAPDICSVPNLDLIFIGLGDLSQSLGIVGHVDHPEVLQCARTVLAAARAGGKTAAMLVESPDVARMWQQEGVRVFACGVDISTLSKSLLSIRKAFDPLIE